jgi:chromosome segregation ATPase
MASDYDAAEFVDGDFQAHKASHSGLSNGAGPHKRAPTREEVDSRVAETQQKLADLKRAQEELERERSSLEETRRRQMEFQTGRQEMIHHLTRGLGLLEEAEFNTRRDAEQMAKSLVDLRDALVKIEAIREETWTKDNFTVELTRALTVLENARMEWNGARLKLPALAGALQENNASADPKTPVVPDLMALRFGQLCRIGLAATWPLAVVGLCILAALVVMLFRH